MTSVSWEIGYEPRRHEPCRLCLMDHSYPKVEFWNISSDMSDILETHDIRPSTSR